MNRTVESDMNISIWLFNNLVWPMCKENGLFSGDLIRMEGRPDVELANMLDYHSGIDGWHIHKINGIRGIASRVQWRGGEDWRTFTIRVARKSGVATEYQKRNLAINSQNGWLYPFITLQAYAKTKQGPILSIGVIKTTTLYSYITKIGLENINSRWAYDGKAKFAYITWDELLKNGYDVKIVNG